MEYQIDRAFIFYRIQWASFLLYISQALEEKNGPILGIFKLKPFI